MISPLHVCILTSTALALMLAVPHSAFARDLDAGTIKPAATFDERYPVEPTPPAPPPPAESPAVRPPAAETPAVKPPPAETPVVKKEEKVPQAFVQHVPPPRAASTKHPRSQVVVVPRSFLDAGTEVLPGERKFLDNAFPPTHTPMETVQNIGGRVGWHNSPLPGPFFPSQY
jgi:hypothetical protein